MGLYRWCGKQLPNQIYKLPIQGYSDEKSSMKNLQFILLVVVFTSIISNTASAQWAYDDFSSYDQIQMEIERQNRMMIEQSQRIMQELQARQNRAHQLAIQEYRQQYNDYQTSDAQVLEILWQQFLRENPNYIQNQQQLHNQRMADIQSGHTVERLRELGFEASGIDQIKKHPDMMVGDITKPIENLDRFQSAVCVDCIELLYDEQVQGLFANMKQVQRQAFSIHNGESTGTGQELHVNRRPFDQWRTIIEEHFVIDQAIALHDKQMLYLTQRK